MDVETFLEEGGRNEADDVDFSEAVGEEFVQMLSESVDDTGQGQGQDESDEDDDNHFPHNKIIKFGALLVLPRSVYCTLMMAQLGMSKCLMKCSVHLTTLQSNIEEFWFLSCFNVR
eukprot:Seg1951.6 transcript_id=Seg1951.6/GoldUCD/mRNA.D3Y31 product="hypothetical protein" protein_id=Seg1951.6/GoldUCD/D3Y31